MTASDGDRLRVLVAMSGGVDSSVAAARLLEQGHRVVGVTMKLWGGETDTGCCSVSDVDDARRVAQQLGVDHHVFNFGDDFTEHVVEPYVAAHAEGLTPNPCIECNRHLKFDRLLRRADALGFDLVATGHHARVVGGSAGGAPFRIARGADPLKDQSYVLSMLDQPVLRRLRLPVGDLTKAEVRIEADRLGLRTAGKPDSQDVCFITSTAGREGFLGRRIPLTEGVLVDAEGEEVGRVPAVQLVTIGQRKGLGLAGSAEPRFAVAVDVPGGVVRIGTADDLLVDELSVHTLAWCDTPVDGRVLAQCSAHGPALPATLVPSGGPGGADRPDRVVGAVLRFDEPQRRVAPGQTIAFYRADEVLGSGIVAA